MGAGAMNLLFTGSGRSGSWQIRGDQMGRGVGAKVLPGAIDIGAYDVAVVVKRPPPDLVARIHAACVPLVYDVVDAWPQPVGNGWARAECMAWLDQQISAIGPAAIVAATRAMEVDLAGFGVPVLCLPHHARPGLGVNPIREQVCAVGYEGGERYIAGWRKIVEAECARRGWRFVVNPPGLADVDIVIALRDDTGYAPRHWKSNVKLANAQVSGTPFIGGREAGYLEHAVAGCEQFADTPAELSAAFDRLNPQAERARQSAWMRAVAPRLDIVAGVYRAWLEGIACNATALSS